MYVNFSNSNFQTLCCSFKYEKFMSKNIKKLASIKKDNKIKDAFLLSNQSKNELFEQGTDNR